MKKRKQLAKAPAAVEQIDAMIHTIRGIRVMLDSDLAQIYGVSTSRFNEAVKRNKSRFPADFMFQLTPEENASLRSEKKLTARLDVHEAAIVQVLQEVMQILNPPAAPPPPSRPQIGFK